MIEIISSYFRTLAFLKNISSSSLTDLELVAQYKLEGDPALVGALYERYMDLVYGVCLKYLKQPENAQDSVINIFEELLEKLKKHEIENFRAWLHTVAKNHCLMRLRDKGNKDLKELNEKYAAETDSNLYDLSKDDKAYDFLEESIKELNEEQRQCVILFYLKKKSYAEISAATGYNAMQVKSYIQNGKRNLKTILERKMRPEHNHE